MGHDEPGIWEVSVSTVYGDPVLLLSTSARRLAYHTWAELIALVLGMRAETNGKRSAGHDHVGEAVS